MALSPTQLDRLPDSMVQLMSELQDEIISDICRRITKADMLTSTAEWQLYKANQLTISSREVKRRIASKLKVQEKALKDLYTDAVKTAIAEDAKVYKIAIAEGILSDDYRDKLTRYTRSAAFTNVLKKGLKNTNGLLRNLTNSAAAAANRQLYSLVFAEMENGDWGIICNNYLYTKTGQQTITSPAVEVTPNGEFTVVKMRDPETGVNFSSLYRVLSAPCFTTAGMYVDFGGVPMRIATVQTADDVEAKPCFAYPVG